MDDDKRAHLENLSRQLDELAAKHDAADDARVQELQGQLKEALDSGEHASLRDRLMEDAIGFENDHPALSAVIIRAAELLGAAGL